MATFVQVGTLYINLDRIVTVRVEMENGSVKSVTVWYSGDGKETFHGTEAQQLAAYVAAHRAT